MAAKKKRKTKWLRSSALSWLFSAIKNNDKVGLIAFTDTIEMFIPPKKGVSHVLRLIRELLFFRPRRSKTDIAGALDYLGRVIRKRGVVFLVSDFIAPDYDKPLGILAKRHDLIAVTMTDPRETDVPGVGLIELEDAETGEVMLLDTSDRRVRDTFASLGRDRLRRLDEQFAAKGVDHIPIMTDHDYLQDLMRFFKTREKRRH
ncbi:DUF58 domain-containing protein [Thermodesulfobacteriota bacterium]